MEKLFRVNILTSGEKIFEGEASSLIVPAALGYLGVLANHAPLIAATKSGRITLKDASGATKTFIAEAGGFLQVMHNQATILLDSA